MNPHSIPAPRSAWRFYPHAMIGALATVVAVNMFMVWSATSTFPGAVNDHAFDTGNNYNEVLASAARQAALGWQLELGADGTKLAVRLTGKDGKALTGATLQASAEHPVGPADRTELAFAEANGRYVASRALPGAGQWQIELTVKRDGQEDRVTRRLVLK